jgi:hypothetical protein
MPKKFVGEKNDSPGRHKVKTSLLIDKEKFNKNV